MTGDLAVILEDEKLEFELAAVGSGSAVRSLRFELSLGSKLQLKDGGGLAPKRNFSQTMLSFVISTET